MRFDICVESINGSPHVLTETNKNNETLRAENVLASDKLIVFKMSKRLSKVELGISVFRFYRSLTLQ